MLIFYDPASKIEKFEKVFSKEYESFSYVSARNMNLLYNKELTNKKGKTKSARG
jgi:hypothetical protein